MSIDAKLAKMTPKQRKTLLLKEMRKSQDFLERHADLVGVHLMPRIITLLGAVVTYFEQEQGHWK